MWHKVHLAGEPAPLKMGKSPCPFKLSKVRKDGEAMDDIKKITSKEASQIIDTRKPLGKFYLIDKGIYVGIDNSSGDAWTEEFDSFEAMVKWQHGLEDEEELEME
ncbi:hypothetical protein [Desulfitibacter alkalitolerans]|uniref:hypothetical protein n=1 Tax=Desulfitibacter alkalitolerans TaxID=264641 RepID=UPI000487096B|nr:hypothetical protein [Desulfitibacter alkalitolerans]